MTKPNYILDKCEKCNSLLIQTIGFEDDWVCHKCNIAYLDWPEEELKSFREELQRRVKDSLDHPERLIPWEEVKKNLLSSK